MTRERRKSIERSRRRQRGTWGGTYSMRGMCASPKALEEAVKAGNQEKAAIQDSAKPRSMLVRFLGRLFGRGA
jgi:hypothetical protein